MTSLQPVADMLMLLRYDLSIALFNGSTPIFYCQPHESVTLYPGQLLLASEGYMYSQNDIWIGQLEDNLLTACQVMRRFCLMVNLALAAQQTISPELIHETMTSVMYRLLHGSIATGVIDEAIHLGLLTFSYHIFIQWQNIKLPYQHLLKRYQDCLQSLKVLDSVTPRLMLWLLMTGAISLFDISSETWLRKCLRESIDRCHIKSWKEMQDTLESFMWIAVLDEQLGKQIYDELDLGVGVEEPQSSTC
jgi:hypothetical protein